MVLPAPFGPITAVTPPSRDLEIDGIDGDQAAEPPRHALQGQQRHALPPRDWSAFASSASSQGLSCTNGFHSQGSHGASYLSRPAPPLAANTALSGQLAWTPGGYGVAFGRMLQDSIVAQYLRDHCPRQQFKLYPDREVLPGTADQFLWGHSMFRQARPLYPVRQAEAALAATTQQLVLVATGEGTNVRIPHTYGIIDATFPLKFGRCAQRISSGRN